MHLFVLKWSQASQRRAELWLLNSIPKDTEFWRATHPEVYYGQQMNLPWNRAFWQSEAAWKKGSNGFCPRQEYNSRSSKHLTLSVSGIYWIWQGSHYQLPQIFVLEIPASSKLLASPAAASPARSDSGCAQAAYWFIDSFIYLTVDPTHWGLLKKQNSVWKFIPKFTTTDVQQHKK